MVKIFKSSLSTGEVPNDWRTLNVAPIFRRIAGIWKLLEIKGAELIYMWKGRD